MSEELENEGWVIRTTIDEPRLSEIILEYESLVTIHIQNMIKKEERNRGEPKTILSVLGETNRK